MARRSMVRTVHRACYALTRTEPSPTPQRLSSAHATAPGTADTLATENGQSRAYHQKGS